MSRMNKGGRLWKTREVAERCGVTARTVAVWLRTGKMRGRKLNGFQWRVTEADLVEFLEDQA